MKNAIGNSDIASLSEAVKVFSAFGDETRLAVLELLLTGEKFAGVLLKQLDIKQPTLSHHMKILVESGLVRARKSGKCTYYSICESTGQYAAGLLEQFTTLKISDNTETPLSNKIITIKDGLFMNPISDKGAFSIMVDTSCDLPPEFIAENGIEKLPITFDLEFDSVRKEHNEGYWQEISAKEFYDALRNGGVAKTAQINPETFNILFTEYAKQGRDLLFITLSGGLSGTYQSSQIALQEVKETYPDCNIYTVDSISASVGIGLLADLAVQKRNAGASVKETAAWLEQRKHNCLGLFTVDDLMYLHRGGRLNKLSAIAGSVLKLKPLLNLTPAGTLAVKDKARGRKAAVQLLAEQFERSVNPETALDTVYVAHTDCDGEAQALAEMLKERANIQKVVVMMMGPVIGAHVGPGALIVLFESTLTRDEYEDKFYNKKA